MKSSTIYLISGPNLNLLELRDASLYGGISLEDIVSKYVRPSVESADFSLEEYQSNSEGDLINYLQAKLNCINEHDGILINPAAFSHTSVALLDLLELMPCPIIEVHLSNLAKREEFRRVSITAAAASGVIYGFGPYGYQLATIALLNLTRA